MNYFEFACVYSSRCKALAPTRLVAPPTDRGHRPYRNADGRYERAGVGEFPPSLNARFFVRIIFSFRSCNLLYNCCSPLHNCRWPGLPKFVMARVRS